MAGEYPTRETHFAHRVIRLMARTCAAQEIGTDGTWLVTVIAHTEHAKWYSSAVTFWNDQLMGVSGFSVGQLVRARKKAVDAGWLHYEAGGKGKVGRYWVCIPRQYERIPDGSVESDPPVILRKNEQDTERESQDKRKTTGGETEEKCATFIPTPIPTPNSDTDTDADTEASPDEDETDKESHWADEHPDVAAEASEPVEPLKAGKLDATSVYAGMTPDVVRSPTTIVSWFRRQLSAKAPVLAPTRADLLLAVCASLKASEPGSVKPVGVFVDLIKHHRWRAVKRYRDRAEEIIKKELSRDLARSN